MQKFDTSGPVAAVLNIPAGRVQVIAANRTDTAVEILPADPAKRRDVQTAERTTVAHTDGVLRIHTPEHGKKIFGPAGALEVTIKLPAGSRVEAHAASCEFRAVGRLGDIVLEGGHRQIKIDEAAGVRLTAHDSDIVIGRLGGPAEISTEKGDIRIAEALRGTVELHTHSGDISVGVAAGVSASLDASTALGRISNSLKSNGTAEVGIRATTSHGDITASSL